MVVSRRAFISLAGSLAAAGSLSQFEAADAADLRGLLAGHELAGPRMAEHILRHRIIYGLPASDTPRWAWTIDDGISGGSIRTYTDKALANSAIKYTYFVTSMYTSWSKNHKNLAELIARGQVQLANHTYNHPDLTAKSTKGVERSLMDCHHFIEDKFGVDARPFWRPPYGYYNARVLQAAADIGYTAPVMWFGSLATDSRHVTKTRILANANQWIASGRVVIDHANNMVAADHFDALYATIAAKNLQMVTLREAYPSY